MKLLIQLLDGLLDAQKSKLIQVAEIFFLVFILVLLLGGGLIVAFTEAFSFAKAIWNLISAVGTIILALSILSLLASLPVLLISFLEKISNPKNWF